MTSLKHRTASVNNELSPFTRRWKTLLEHLESLLLLMIFHWINTKISKQCQGSSTLFVETNCFFSSWHLCRAKTLGHVVFFHQLVWNSKLYIICNYTTICTNTLWKHSQSIYLEFCVCSKSLQQEMRLLERLSL